LKLSERVDEQVEGDLEMDIVFGETSITTERRRVAVSLDKGETAVLVVGINRIEVMYVDGGWRVACNQNIDVDQAQSDDRFVQMGVDLSKL